MDELGFGLIALLLLLFTGKKKDEPADEDDSDRPRIPIPDRGGDRGDGTDEPTTFDVIPDALPDITPDEPKPGGDKGPPLPEIVDTYPRPASFYQVQKNDIGLGIARRYLLSAGWLAAKEIGHTDDATANAFAKQVANNAQRQARVWKAINCTGFNDATVTTHGWAKKSMSLAPTGRVVRLVPQHADNLARLRNGQPALRNMRFRRPKDEGKGNGHGVNAHYRHFETLWLPGISLKKLWESDGTDLVFGGGEWGNSGVSKAHPPPWVLDLGLRFEPGAEPPTSTFGCNDLELEWK